MKKLILGIITILTLIVSVSSGCVNEKEVDTYVDFEFNFINSWNKTASIALVWQISCNLDEDLASSTILEPNNSTTKYSNHSHCTHQFITFHVQVIDNNTTSVPPETETKSYRWEVKGNSAKFIININENGEIEINNVAK